MENENVITQLGKSVAELGEKIEKGVATKQEVEQVSQAVKGLENRMQEAADKGEKVPFFGNKYIAEIAAAAIVNAATDHPNFKLRGTDPAHRYTKAGAAALVSGTTTGSYALPAELDPVVSELILKYGFARRFTNVLYGVAGTRNILTSADDTVTYAVADDRSATVTESTPTLATGALTCAQIITLSKISEKLLRESPVAMSALLINKMARSQARYEDDQWLNGANGIEDNTSVPCTSVASLAALTLDDLLTIQYQASEAVDGEGQFFICREAVPVLRKLKASSAGTYLIDIQAGQFSVNGAPVNVIPRMHSGSTTGDMVVFYGSPDVASTMGVGRDKELAVDASVDFLKAGLCYRLISDIGFLVVQPTAVAKARIASTT